MSAYRAELTTAAARELPKLDAVIRRRILAGIAGLEGDLRPAGCKKLAGEDNAWRIRIGDYRVLFDVQDEVLVVAVVRVARRRRVYH